MRIEEAAVKLKEGKRISHYSFYTEGRFFVKKNGHFFLNGDDEFDYNIVYETIRRNGNFVFDEDKEKHKELLDFKRLYWSGWGLYNDHCGEITLTL